MTSTQTAEQTDEYHQLMEMINQLDPNGKPQIRWVYRASKHIEALGKRLGVFSGSFNPLTVAHIKMIEEAQANFELDEILLVLAKANVDKGVFGLSLAERLLMLKRYAMNRDDFSVAACSHGRFIEKIEALKAVYPPGTRFSFILGYDTLVRIFDPKYYTDFHGALKALFDQCRLIVANRQEHDADSVRQFLASAGHQRYENCIDLIELSHFYAGVSSTEIRARLERGLSIDHLVPPVIQEFLSATGA